MHIKEALGIEYSKAHNLMFTISKICKTTQTKPTNNPHVKFTTVKHVDINEAIVGVEKLLE